LGVHIKRKKKLPFIMEKLEVMVVKRLKRFLMKRKRGNLLTRNNEKKKIKDTLSSVAAEAVEAERKSPPQKVRKGQTKGQPKAARKKDQRMKARKKDQRRDLRKEEEVVVKLD